ncbi:ABC transporter permease [Rhodoligotrophos defluvii]|uniref:ABC transporter permease n=1 Tax=Rhodoligotrophos defluvii TaxID=2561934 RepID=UPI0010C9E1E5|nr:ABC transporter permease [Rhodoligotrophos defluvii]
MTVYILRRLLAIVGILIVTSVLIFGVTQVLPGNVAYVIVGQFATPEVVAAVEQRLGLNDPVYVQYWRWASGILRGDLGQSMVMDRPVAPLIWDALRASALLAVLSFICVTIIGIALGVIAAVRRNKLTDHAVSMFTYLGISVPEFFWGIVLIILFARYLHWLPSGGIGDSDADWGTRLKHLILPTATLTFTLIAHVSRLTRSSMIETLRSNYVRNARAKGLPERVVIYGHALRNALLPTITVLAIDVGWLIGGIVVVESVFAYPGLGRLLIFAIERHDLPLIQGTILIIAAIYAVANLIADLLYAFFNPKIRYA